MGRGRSEKEQTSEQPVRDVSADTVLVIEAARHESEALENYLERLRALSALTPGGVL